MHFSQSFVAQVTLGAPEPSKVAKFVLSDPLIIIGIAAFIFAVLVFYVAIIRGPKQQGRSRRVYKSSETGSDEASSGESGHRRKRKKTRRREHRGRNPTLAQTGGLPPPQNPTKEAEFFG